MDLGFQMHAERTPNPNCIKWVLGQPLVEPGTSGSFEQAPSPGVSPLAASLFAVRGVTGVFIASRFVTVTKSEEVEWPDIAEELVDTIKCHAASGEPALGPDFEPSDSAGEDEATAEIRRILDEEIRPAVAMDGGDVIFAGYQDGRVEVILQGACSGCPSSTATLRFGIEARLKEAVPEILEVVAV